MPSFRRDTAFCTILRGEGALGSLPAVCTSPRTDLMIEVRPWSRARIDVFRASLRSVSTSAAVETLRLHLGILAARHIKDFMLFRDQEVFGFPCPGTANSSSYSKSLETACSSSLCVLDEEQTFLLLCARRVV